MKREAVMGLSLSRRDVLIGGGLMMTAPSASRADVLKRGAQFETIRFQISSRHFGSSIPAVAFVPAGTAPATGWHLVLLLHGLGGAETDWLTMGNAAETYAELLNASATPAVVIMPGMGSNWYVDAAHPGGPRAETALIEEVLPFARQRFTLSEDPQHLSIIGNSMGGYGALRFAIKYPEKFGRVAALSPAIWQNVPADELDLPPDRINLLTESSYFHAGPDRTITRGIALPNPGPHFNKVFGEPFDARRFNVLNPFTLIQKRIADGGTLPKMFVTVGADDSHLLWRGAIALFETMKAGQKQIAFRITGGDHTWDVWRSALPEALSFALTPQRG